MIDVESKRTLFSKIKNYLGASILRASSDLQESIADHSSPNHLFAVQGHEKKTVALQTRLSDLLAVEKAVNFNEPTKNISEGSLIEMRMIETKKSEMRLFLVLSCLHGLSIPIEIQGRAVSIISNEQFGIELLGRAAGDDITLPMIHGDGRDIVKRLIINKIV